jgi:hypothetical protein
MTTYDEELARYIALRQAVQDANTRYREQKDKLNILRRRPGSPVMGMGTVVNTPSIYPWQDLRRTPPPKSFTVTPPPPITGQGYWQPSLPLKWPVQQWIPSPEAFDFKGGFVTPVDPPRTIDRVRRLQGGEPSLQGGFFGNDLGDFTDHWQTGRFDAFAWNQSGANTRAFFSAAGADRLSRIINSPSRLARLYKFRNIPSVQDELDKVLDFYGRQYFSYRKEGEDVEEHYKSIIGNTPVGRFIEDVLDDKITTHQDRLAVVSRSAADTLKEIRILNRQKFLTKTDKDRKTELYDQLREFRDQQRMLGRQLRDYQSYAYYRPGLQDITKLAKDLDVSLDSWEQIFRDKNLTRSQRETLNALTTEVHLARKGGGPLPAELSLKYRQLLGELDPRLANLMPRSREEQLLLAQQSRLSQTYNFLALRAAGAISPDENKVQAVFRTKGAYGLQARIERVVDLNAYELTRGGTATDRVQAPLGSARLGLLITPTELTSGTYLRQMGLRPGVTDPNSLAMQQRKIAQIEARLDGLHRSGQLNTDIGRKWAKVLNHHKTALEEQTSILRVLREYPANKQWYEGDNAQMREAADIVYTRISRSIRSLVGNAVGELGLTDIASSDSPLYKAILDSDKEATPARIAEQLLAYYHVPATTFAKSYSDAMYQIFIEAAEGDPFASQVRQILDKAVPGLANIKAIRKPGEGAGFTMPRGYREEVFNEIERTFTAKAMTTRKGVFAQVPEIYEHVTRPRAVNEVKESYSKAEEFQMAHSPDEWATTGRPNSGNIDELTDTLSSEMEAAQLAVKGHELQLEVDYLKHTVDTWSLSDAGKRSAAIQLSRAQHALTKYTQELAQQSPRTRERIDQITRAMTPLRAAEYELTDIPESKYSFPIARTVDNVSYPLRLDPEYIRIKEYIDQIRGYGEEVTHAQRLNYVVSRYTKSAAQLAGEAEEARLGRASQSERFFQRLRRTGIGAASRNGINMRAAYDEMANILGDRYGMSEMTDYIKDAMLRGPEDERTLSPFYARTIHDFRDTMQEYEGTNFDLTEGPFRSIYEQLGGEGAPQLKLAGMEPNEIEDSGELWASNKTMHTIKGKAVARFELPENLTEEERARTLAAIKTPEFLEQWVNDPSKRQIVDYYNEHKVLSEKGVSEVMEAARQLLRETNEQFHVLQAFGEELLTPQGGPLTGEEHADLIDHFIDILGRNIASRTVRKGVREEKVPYEVSAETIRKEATRLADTIAEFGQWPDWGRTIVPVSNDENIQRAIAFNKFIPRVGPRNTVTNDRFAKNLAAADHYFNWSHNASSTREYGKRLNTSLTNPISFPVVNGEHLSRAFFDESLKDLDKHLQSQGMNLRMLEELSDVLRDKSVWLGSERLDPLAASKARDIVGTENIMGPLALGNKIDIGAETTRSLSDLWGHYIMMRNAGPKELRWMGEQLGVDFSKEDISKMNRKRDILNAIKRQTAMRTEGGKVIPNTGIDLSAENARNQMINFFSKHVSSLEQVLADEEAQNVLAPEQQARIRGIFQRHQIEKVAAEAGEEPPPRIGQPGRRAADIGREAEEELREAKAAAAKPGFRPITVADMTKLWRGNKAVRRGTIGLGAFGLWGLIRSHHDKERTLAQMQGPQNLPGGNTPYTRELPPSTVTAVPSNEYANPISGSPGYIYRIRAAGNINPDQFQAQVMNMTGSSMRSGSIYDNRAIPNPDSDMYNTMNQY